MASRFLWSLEQVESFFKVLLQSYQDYLIAKELRRMDEFYDMIGSCIGASGLIVQNFLKKTGRSYRDIILQAELCVDGEDVPERKLRGSERVYSLYEQYHQMYSLGSKESMSLSASLKIANIKEEEQASTSSSKTPSTKSTVRKRKLVDNSDRSDAECPPKKSPPKPEMVQNIVEQAAIQDNSFQNNDDVQTTCMGSREHTPYRVRHTVPTGVSHQTEKNARNNSKQHTQKATTAGDEGVFGKSPDFNQQFLKLMENQNEILANIADELNLIRHAVLDVNGLTAITYVK
ncbi:uncharacterized protein LOC117301160 [Asterias rubens]|uniref:uncharacterized protein LOC117301160 n=1 Tax=Asterias rubens TaxID=7604 RepID=UPI0014552249|nr:uncharacterized protein LOC117301160 [Asterias rubens]